MSPHPLKMSLLLRGNMKNAVGSCHMTIYLLRRKDQLNNNKKPNHPPNQNKQITTNTHMNIEPQKSFLAVLEPKYTAKSDCGQYLASAGWRLDLRYRVLRGHGRHRRGQRWEDSRSQGHCRGNYPWHPIGRLNRLLRRGNHRITRLVPVGRVIGGLGRDAVDCGWLGEAWGERERGHLSSATVTKMSSWIPNVKEVGTLKAELLLVFTCQGNCSGYLVHESGVLSMNLQRVSKIRQ